MPSCQTTTFRDRPAVRLENGLIEAVVLPGGGHLARLSLSDLDLNPLWEPPWPGVDPEHWGPAHHAAYGVGEGRLLSAIAGHNLCLDHFGDLSPAEVTAGGCFHGEAPNRQWTVEGSGAEADGAWLRTRVECPEAGVRFSRTLRLAAGSPVASFEEEVVNLFHRDNPLGWQQHVTIGPPFVEPGVTRVDIPGTRGRTFPRPLGASDLLAPDADYAWPHGPGAKGGAVRLDVFPPAPAASNHGVLLEPAAGDAFVAAWNPARGLMLVYVFPATVFPWISLWIENRSIAGPPWDGKTLAWGLEFGTVPLPVTRIETLSAGPLFGRPRFAVLPAKGTLRVSYQALLARIPADWGGVEAARRGPGGIELRERGRGRTLAIPAF